MKMSKTKQKEFEIYKRGVERTATALDNAIGKYNKGLGTSGTVDLLPTVNAALAQYNVAANDTVDFCHSFAEEVQEYYDSKSEGWQEGDAGEAHSSWATTYEEVEYDAVTLEDITLKTGKLEFEDTLGPQLDELTTEPEV